MKDIEMQDGMAAEGVQGVWAAVPTPFDRRLEVDEAGLRRNVGIYRALGLNGIFINGLMGEVWSLTLPERRRILELTLAAAGPHLKVACVTTAATLRETLELTTHAAIAGCHYAVVLNPSGPRTRDALKSYFESICADAALDLIVFNNAAAGYTLTPDFIAELVRYPRVKAVKTTAPFGEIQATRRLCPPGFLVSDPLEESYFANHLLHGQRALFADPEPYLYQRPESRPMERYLAHLSRHELGAAWDGYRALQAVRAVYNEWIMDPLLQGRMPNAALKLWCEAIGMAAGSVRPPLGSLPPEAADKLRSDVTLALERLA